MLLTKKVNGVEIAYKDSGFAEGPAIVLYTGWCHDTSLYAGVVPYLATKYRVIEMNWRAHGPNRDPIPDFGVEEQFQDSAGLLEQLEVDQFYIISHSHGGWVALETADRLGRGRVLGVLMIDQIMTNPPPGFATDLQGMQTKTTWRAARKSLFDDWLPPTCSSVDISSSSKPVQDHIVYSLSSFGFDLWSLSCRVIYGAYSAHGSPMGRMKKMAAGSPSMPPIRHVFSHPLDKPSYRQLHVDFARENPWFSWCDLQGQTHFPSLELPGKVAEQLEEVIKLSSR